MKVQAPNVGSRTRMCRNRSRMRLSRQAQRTPLRKIADHTRSRILASLNFRASIPIVQIRHESLRRTADVKEIHRVSAHAWKFRSLILARISALGGGHDFSTGAPAKPARSERKRPVTAVV